MRVVDGDTVDVQLPEGRRERVRLSAPARAFLAWFGPRGLSSLLLALLLVLNDVPQAEPLLAVTGVVVIASVILHGASATPVAAWYGRTVARTTLPEERESTAAGLFEGAPDEGDGIPRVTPPELAALLQAESPPLVLDVRTRSQYERDHSQIPGSVRVLPDDVDRWAAAQPEPRAVVAYCT